MTSTGRGLFRRASSNVVWAFAAEGIGKGTAFLIMVLLARALGAASFGTFMFIYTLFNFLWMGVDLGLAMYGTREIARRPEQRARLVSAILVMRFVLAVSIALLALLSSLVWLADPASRSVALALSLYLVFRAIYLDWYLRGIERYAALALVSALIAAGMLATAFVVIRSGDDLGNAGLPWAIGYGLGALAILGFVLRSGVRIELKIRGSWENWVSHWRESVFFTLSNGVSFLYQSLPLFYLFVWAGPETAGQFGAAFRTVIAAIFALSILPMAVYPIFADFYARAEKRFVQLVRRTVFVTGAISIIAAAVAMVAGQEVVELLFGNDYAQSATALKILSLFLVLRAIRAVFVRAVGAAGFQREYSKIAALSVIAVVALLGLVTVAGLPPLEYASLALVITEVFVLAAMWRLHSQIANARFG